MTQRSLRALVVGLVIGLSAGALGSGLAGSAADPAAPDVQLVQMPLTSATFARLAERVTPAVINVTIKGVAPRNPLEEFFGGPDRQPRPRRGLSSGVIIDPSGVALTNAHVVQSAEQVEVTLHDGTRRTARVAGRDPKTDLAVLRIETDQDLPHLRLGDSDEVRVGDWVIAVGAPFGLRATVTSGIVSAKARQIGAGPYDDFLQTDAAINPGNSGGPLVNMRGEVIGINTAIIRGGNGIGFAIPSNMARNISTQLLTTGTVSRGWLGVTLQPLTPELAASFDARDTTGVLVSEVVPDSPAARAGLAPGDIIMEFDGKQVRNPTDLARAVGLARPGHQARLTVWRNGRTRTLTARLDEAPGIATRTQLGLQVAPEVAG